jgi:DNA repair photolyase
MPHRFTRLVREAADDGWSLCEPAPEEGHGEGPGPLQVPTQWRWEVARSALTRNQSPDLPFDLSLNPYRGCEHGCIYCYARPTHGYLDLSPGLDFETRLVAKRNVAELLQAELTHPRYRPGCVALGTVTDAYQPLDRKLGLARACLQVLVDARHPVAAVTKGSAIERDLDLWATLARQGLAVVYVTITTLDPELARRLEPRAPTPARRLRTIAALAQAGVPVGVSLSPQIPFLNTDMERVLAAAAEAGARRAFCIPLRLPWEVAPLFKDWLLRHHPDRADRVMARVRDMRGGRDNDARFGSRMRGEGPWADLLHQRFRHACRKLGLNGERQPMSTELFRAPGPVLQATLF